MTQGLYVETATTSPPWVVVLFAGNEGALHLDADGASTLKGNFVVRTAGYWVRHGDALHTSAFSWIIPIESRVRPA